MLIFSNKVTQHLKVLQLQSRQKDAKNTRNTIAQLKYEISPGFIGSIVAGLLAHKKTNLAFLGNFLVIITRVKTFKKFSGRLQSSKNLQTLS